jgi:hypothetical protein
MFRGLALIRWRLLGDVLLPAPACHQGPVSGSTVYRERMAPSQSAVVFYDDLAAPPTGRVLGGSSTSARAGVSVGQIYSWIFSRFYVQLIPPQTQSGQCCFTQAGSGFCCQIEAFELSTHQVSYPVQDLTLQPSPKYGYVSLGLP